MRGLIVLSLAIILFTGCGDDSGLQYHTWDGQTMGTYYRITYGANSMAVTREDIEKELRQLNQSLSTYMEESVISQFNQSSEGLSGETLEPELASYFFDNVRIAKEIYGQTGGYFDPTVMPLVNYWGFGYDPVDRDLQRDSGAVENLMQLVGFDKIQLSQDGITVISKAIPAMELDLSASAKGYAIDHLGRMLEQKWDVQNYLIDIGGESRGKGVNAHGQPWKIGISDPIEQSSLDNYSYVVSLKDRSIATSGNYRNFYQRGGETISHTINPLTGFYERNNLLSVSVVTSECAYADGFATACMAMGYEKAVKMIESNPSLQALFIYVNEDGSLEDYLTVGMTEIVEKIK